ncbi:hypothetical protein CPB84DRAFT_1770528, partial [Gymnopilus junonius]
MSICPPVSCLFFLVTPTIIPLSKTPNPTRAPSLFLPPSSLRPDIPQRKETRLIVTSSHLPHSHCRNYGTYTVQTHNHSNKRTLPPSSSIHSFSLCFFFCPF